MLTYRDLMNEHESDNMGFCIPFHGDSKALGNFDHEFDFLILFEGQAHSLYLDGEAIHDPSEEDLKKFAKAINPDYDLYDGWDDLHIALDVMTECGCSRCPFKDECEEMDNELQNEDVYFVVDMKDGDMFTEFYLNEDEAIDAAIAEWNRLSDHDKKLREAFYVGFGKVEDGCVPVDHDVVYDIMERENKEYIIRDREAGNEIARFDTLEEAEQELVAYEEEDRRNGEYTPDFYEIVED